ncbi:NADH-quinone oxidoreductase subunit K [Thermoactinomyces sp. DSM 45891]|uniref:NADH-quinone oxidoreductase subunit NuoK n=1 Tax=Thermoactinomyces sp. DSM 45891 TaxID=1761907 RepID=UPI000916ACD2|nr:NADH-quinone oxidoreductase subunit NuoK [Thermoactinomyces sp. DSM 45891]SFX23963.1 NADH-quinone oxidoreductase subunit K [Thermoactinomyces sp. DSM 45891]
MLIASYLALAAILFVIGLIGVLTKRNAVIVLFSLELMLNAANINLVIFSKMGLVPNLNGQVFALFNVVVAAAEAAVGLAILFAIYRNRETIDAEKFNLLKG